MKKSKILLFFQVVETYYQYEELFPFKKLEQEYDFKIYAAGDRQSRETTRLNVTKFTRLIHTLFHYSELKRKKFTTIFYNNRAEFLRLSPNSSSSIKFHIYKKKNIISRLIIFIFSNSVGIWGLRKFLIILFSLESVTKSSHLRNFSFFILPYTGGFSAEWDFLIWFAKKNEIPSVGIQENWDNLSSKAFLMMHPEFFLVWGPQSGSHLRVFHNFKGMVIESGCLRLQGLYEIRRRLLSPKNSIKSNQVNSEIKILYVDSGFWENDEKILLKLSDHLKLSHNLLKNIKIMYRLNPQSHNSPDRPKFLKALQKIPGIELYVPHRESNQKRHKQILESDIIISIFSTYVLEASILNKKCLVPTFGSGFKNHNPLKLIDDVAHFQGMSLLEGVHVATCIDDLIHFINDFQSASITTNDPKLLNWFCRDLNTDLQVEKLVSKFLKL